MPSTFAWLDSSEKQRRRMKDVLDLFREQGTRDELGLSTVRDAVADALFPGTGALQTRARYFLFIPWMYRAFEQAKVSSSEIDRKARRFEIQLIDVLCDSADPQGTIGRQSRAALQRLPSSIYWSGLGVVRLRQFAGSQEQYHRSLDRYYRFRRGIRNDDGEPVDALPPNWAHVVPPPPDFPKVADFAMGPDESAFLSERFVAAAPNSFLAFLLRQSSNPGGVCQFPWDPQLLEKVSEQNRRELEHARNFSLLMHGASILYNLMLAEKVNNAEWAEGYRRLFAEWSAEFAQSVEAFDDRPLDDLWRLTEEWGVVIRTPTRKFVGGWLDLSRGARRLEALADDADARRLVHRREVFLKHGLARLDNQRARELWTGAAGVGRLTYRWYNTRILCADIFAARQD
jgi:hypothetical protein